MDTAALETQLGDVDVSRWWNAERCHRALVDGEITAEQWTRLALTWAQEDELGTFLFLDAEGALAQATQLDRQRAGGETLGPLAGMTLALKDNICTLGATTSCGSRILEGYLPPFDATVVERLRRAGAVIVGKTNMDEFAMGSSNENSAYGNVHNPWNRDRAPGGSSGGSAVATAAGMVSCSLGSDTGGSVRQPGAFCGVTAVKPTYGRVSRYGLVAFASSLDQIGPFARSARDAANVLQVIAGDDPRDATCSSRPVDDYVGACGQPVKGMRVGLLRTGDGDEPGVKVAMGNAVAALKELGCDVVDVELPHAKYGVSVYYLVATAEASSNLARFDGMRYGLRVTGEDLTDTYNSTRARGFGPEVQRRIMLGTYALSAGYYDAYYMKAQKVRTLMAQDFEKAFVDCDVVLSPTSPTTAFKLGERTRDPLSMYLADVYTLPASLAGLPAVSVPCGFDDEGLPVGMQMVAPAFEESRLFTLAHAYEQVTEWNQRHPDVASAGKTTAGKASAGKATAGKATAGKGGAA